MTAQRFEYRSDVQGMRAIAVLLVVLYHAKAGLSGGFIGVDVFFVISGYVITGSIVNSLNKKSFSVREFLLRRVKRLFPALCLMMGAVLTLGIMLGPLISQRVSGRTALAATFLNANHYLYRTGDYFNPKTELNYFLHTWSLSVEEQFYLVFPFLVALTLGRARKSWFLTGLIAVGVFSLTVSLLISYHSPIVGSLRESFAFYSSLTRAWQFCAGAILILVPLPNSDYQRKLLGGLGLSTILLASIFIDGDSVYPGALAIVPTIGTVFLLIGQSPILRFPILTRIGDVSYGWYLWHWPLLVFAAALQPGIFGASIAVALSYGLAVLSERWVETPIRHSTRLGSVTWIAIVACALPIMGYVLELATRKVELNSTATQWREVDDHYMRIGCDGGIPYSPHQPQCEWNPGQRRRVVLVGDSNARQLIPVLKDVTKSIPMEFHASTFASCPFLSLTLEREGELQTQCTDWVETTLDMLLRSSPDTVIIASALDGYIVGANWKIASDNKLFAQPEEKQELIEKNLKNIVLRLEREGIKVILVDPIPKFYDLTNRSPVGQLMGGECSVLTYIFRGELCMPTRVTEASNFVSPRVVESLHREASSSKTVIVSTTDSICPKGICKTYERDWIYRDAGHLSHFGAQRLSDDFFKSLR